METTCTGIILTTLHLLYFPFPPSFLSPSLLSLSFLSPSLLSLVHPSPSLLSSFYPNPFFGYINSRNIGSSNSSTNCRKDTVNTCFRRERHTALTSNRHVLDGHSCTSISSILSRRTPVSAHRATSYVSCSWRE